MSDLKTTPCPWKVEPIGARTFKLSSPNAPSWCEEGESEVDARLMSAAPDLLAALAEAVELFESEVYEGTDTVGGVWLDDARAALAKAAGETT